MSTTTLQLQKASVPRNAIATTLAMQGSCGKNVRDLMVGNFLGPDTDKIGFYVRPTEIIKPTSNHINRVRLVYELMRKEHLLNGLVISDYPIFEAYKDASNPVDKEKYNHAVCPYGLGVSALSYTLQSGRIPLGRLPSSYIYIPDFYVAGLDYRATSFANNMYSWMRTKVDRDNTKFVVLGLYGLNSVSKMWGTYFGSYIQDSFFDIPVE